LDTPTKSAKDAATCGSNEESLFDDFNSRCRSSQRQRSGPAALRRLRAQCRAARNHFNGAPLAPEARRVPADAVSAGQPVSNRAGRYVLSGRCVSALSPSSATERGALFNPDYNLEELDFLRANTPKGGVFVDVGANVGTYAMVLARYVGPAGQVIAIEPHPLTHARLAFNSAASGYRHVKLVAAAAGDSDGELMIETDGGNLGASHIASAATSAGNTIRVPSLRLLRVLGDAGVSQVDSLKIDVEGYEDRVLIGFFANAPQALWPRAVVIEHLSRDEWLNDCLGDMLARGYFAIGKTRSNTLLVRK
jgi:FkbM family methyltransferase